MTKRISGNTKIKSYDYSSLKILIADDCLPMRAIMMRILCELGVQEMAMANNGEEALEVADQFSPDVIFMDRHMPDMTGVEVARRIRNGEAGSPYTPIIMVSGHTKHENICEARDAGVNEFLAKPISANLVLMRLQSIVSNPRNFIRNSTFFGPDRRRRYMPVENDRRAETHEYTAPNRILDVPSRDILYAAA